MTPRFFGSTFLALTRQNPLRRLTGWAAALMLALPLAATPLTALAGAVEQLKAFASATHSAKGEFAQRVVGRNSKISAPSTGEFAFSKPGKFRWLIKKPYEQLILADGQKVYMYDKDLAQVTIRPIADAVSATPAALLFGQGDVDKLFNLREVGNRDGLDWMEAIPKSKDSTFIKIGIGFRDGLPEAMEMHDALGQVTVLTLNKWVKNNLGPSEPFKFTVPAGVDVIEADGVVPTSGKAK